MSNRINPMDQSLINKIDNKISGTSTTRKLEKDAPVGGDGGTSNTSTSDTVELTSNAKLLELLDKQLASLPDVDKSRIDAVRAQIESGKFEIDADEIAGAMLRLETELGQG